MKLWPVVLAAAFGLLPVASADAQWVLSAYAGAMHTRAADVRIEQPDAGTELVFPEVSFDSESWRSPVYYGYRLARRVPGVRWLFVEGELIHGKVYARGNTARGAGTRRGQPVVGLPFPAVVQRFAISHGLNFVLVNAVARQPLPGGRATLTARAGAGPMLPHPEIEVEGVAREGYELAGPGLQAGGGIEFGLWRGVSLLAEYKWTRAHPRLSIDQGTASLVTRSHHLALGLSLTF